MADGDLIKDKIRRTIMPMRKPTPKITQPKEWYQKKRRTMNIKLRQAILDLFPFTMDEEEADRILSAIFDTIYEGLKRDGSVTIPGFGRFITQKVRSGWVTLGFSKDKKRVYCPPRRKTRFKMSSSLRRTIRESKEWKS